MLPGSWPRVATSLVLGFSVSTSSALPTNSDRGTPPQSPLLFTLSAKEVQEIATHVTAQDQTLFKNIFSTVTPETATFNNTIAPYAHYRDEVAYMTAPFTFLVDPTANNASIQFTQTRAAALSNITHTDEYFALVQAVYNNLNSQNQLWTEEGALTKYIYRPLADAGFGISKGPQRAKYTALVTQQTNLSTAWQANLYKPLTTLWYTPAELDGVDAQLLSSLTNGTGANAGKLGVIVDYYYAEVTYTVKSQRVRQEMDIAYNRLYPGNVNILQQAFAGRDEMAQILGYPNYATARLRDTIAGSPENVLALINEIRTTVTPKGHENLNQLNSFIKKEDASAIAYRWDMGYLSSAIDAAGTNLTDDNFGSYFPAVYTVPTALVEFGKAFGFDLQLVQGADLDALSPTGKGSDVLPDPSVSLYAVWNSRANGFVGYLYNDMLARAGKRSNSTAPVMLNPGGTLANGTRIYPNVLLNGGYDPSQHLQSGDLAYLFTVIGNLFWTLSSESSFGDAAGPTSTAFDFMRMPAQLMENFAYNPTVLRKLSKHWSYLSADNAKLWRQNDSNRAQPQMTLPKKTAEKARLAKQTLIGLSTLYKVWFSLFDLQMHMPASHEAAKNLSVSETYNKLAVDVNLVPWGESVVTLADGSPNYSWGWGEAFYSDWVNYYYSRWYSWTWAKVYSEDCYYSRFEADPFNPATGLDFRKKVLSRSGNPKQFVADFLGREATTAAFFHDAGILSIQL